MAVVSFGRWVEHEYSQKRLSQRRFAGLIGVSHSTISTWINKGTQPERYTCYRIAEVLGLDVSDVLERAGYAVDAPLEVENATEPVAESPAILLYGGGKNLTQRQKDELARRVAETVETYWAHIQFVAAGVHMFLGQYAIREQCIVMVSGERSREPGELRVSIGDRLGE